MKCLTIATFVGSIFLASSPAGAWEYEEDACRVSQTFEGAGSTLLSFSQDQEWFDDGDRVFVLLQNDNWSIEHKQDLGAFRFESDEGWFENAALGQNLDELSGIVSMSVPYENFLLVMDGAPESLKITRKGKLVDQLSLAGLSYHFERFKACHAKRQAVVDERVRKERLNRTIPQDPFAAN